MTETKRYYVTLDDRNRLTLKEKSIRHFEVEHLSDGRVMLSPRLLVDPNEYVSKSTLRMIHSSVANAKKGVVSDESFDAEDWNDLWGEDES